MAYANTELSSTIRGYVAADKPTVLANNRLTALTSSTCQFRTSGSWASGSDGTAAASPTSRLYDGYMHLTAAAASAQTTWYLIMDFSGSPITFDSLVIMRHNFASIGGLTVSLEIANNNAYSTNLIELSSLSPGSSTKRLVDVKLDHSASATAGASAREYTAVPYVRIKMTKGASFTPSIGEVILSTRRQLERNPDINWNDKNLVTDAHEFVSASKVKSLYVTSKGQRVIEPSWVTDTAAQISDWDTLYQTDTDFGTKPFVWIDKPTTDPQSAYWMRFEHTEFSAPLVGPTARQWGFSARECGDQFVKLEA